MTAELDNLPQNQDVEKNDKVARKPLTLFITDVDRYGRDILAMSDFFYGYVLQMSSTLKTQSALEIVAELPIANLGIINDVLHNADVLLREKTTLIADFANLPSEIKSKLRKGIFRVAESRQVDGNLRAVIVDENNIRVKDITFKKVVMDPDNIETIRSIGNQLQMRQIYAKLADIQEFQIYQLEKDRDRDIIIPFLDARSLVLEAENEKSEEERVLLYREADGKIRTALNAIYADIETTSKSFARSIDNLFAKVFSNQLNKYMGYLASDFQIAAKFVGVRMQLLDFIGDIKTAKSILQQYQHVMYDFLTKPVTRKGLSTVALMQDYFPYNGTNMNFWHTFSQEMQPKLELGIRTLELGMNVEYANEVYIVSVEEITSGENE